MYYVTAEAYFDAAHFLNGHSGKSANLHGHSFRVLAKLRGEELCRQTEQAGWLLNASDLQDELRALAEALDHRLLIERNSLQLATMDAFENEGFELIELPFCPTAGNLARHFFRELERRNLPVCAVTVYARPDSGVTYEEAPL